MSVKMQINLTFPDGTVKGYDAGTTIGDVAASISSSLRKKAIAGKLNGKVVDLDRQIEADASLEILTLDQPEGINVLRHSTAHLLAQALKRMYPNAKFGVGPVIEDGFYYDIEMDEKLHPEDLAKIEAEMNKIVKQDYPIKRREVSRNDALEIFQDDHLKQELIRELPEGEPISVYEQGEFVDLCRGSHLPSTGKIKAFKLLNIAGAYWRGNSDNQMLQRIYGTAFPSKDLLDEHLHKLEEAKKRDHRKLGKELELFMFSEEAPGMPFYLAKGMAIRNELENFERQLQRVKDYNEVRTPLMMNQELWQQSGHWDNYRENMYFSEVDQTTFALKPMNCPGHMLIFKNKQHSYRELPIRMAEFGQVHRHEFSGALNGMMRVRTFCQDDAHLFVRPDQIEEELEKVIELIGEIYKVFGFEYKVELSTRPEKSMGSQELWDKAESSLENVLKKLGLNYRINEGDGAFYGPKIDFHILDALKRSWQCGTVQLDFQMPEKFDLSYVGEDNQKHRPVVIHRAIYGSIDRFIGIITEHYAGAFPVWLAPTQVKILSVSEKFNDYVVELKRQFEQNGIRTEIDIRDEKLGYKIREAQLEKIPYMFIVGENEHSSKSVSVRKRSEGDIGSKAVGEMIEQILQEIKEKQH